MTKLCSCAKVASGLFLPIDGHFGQIVRYGLQICFALTLIYKPILKSIRPKLAPKMLQKVTKMAISQNPILPSVIHQKAYSSYIF